MFGRNLIKVGNKNVEFAAQRRNGLVSI